MTPELISAIQTFTLDSRKLLEREAEEQLQGLYGWLQDGSFGVGTALGLPEAAETRARLERYVAEEKEAGLDAAASRAKLKRETAFTWLNRAVAIRLMEERGIIKATFGKLHKANAFIYYITDVLGEASIPASTPVNALGEGPVDGAYREFLLWQCEQLAAEVSVLFDPATLSSRFCPRPAVLKVLAESMKAIGIAEAWKAGNEETIGWIYEGFIEDENAVVFEKFSKGKKVLAEEIGAATQRFTPRWIVQFLVQNSIGRIWSEIHPGSRLAASLEYLVPLKCGTERPLKPVKDITFLDPCCGSMHFGLLAFDLFAGMYREERENAGKPGWPETPSASTEEEIPELILSHNLHGIDIDTRAVQISALALMLKARTLNPKAVVTDTNLACANIEQLTGGRLDEFISATPFSHPIYERVLRRLAIRLKDSDHLGSLLRIEDEIKQLVAAERKQSANLIEQIPGFDPEQFKTQEGIEEFFSILTDQISRHLDHFVQASGAGLFASEAAKGLRFLRIVESRYDVVATNPPYLSRSNMSSVMTDYLDNQFKAAKNDLYAAFILRCAELTNSTGLVAMVTMNTFMSISRYEVMRRKLRDSIRVDSLLDLGPRAFPNIGGEKVKAAAFVFRREEDTTLRSTIKSLFIDLIDLKSASDKQHHFEAGLLRVKHSKFDPRVFWCDANRFDAVEGSPWAYSASNSILDCFRTNSKLGKIGITVVGCFTCGNPRFLRYWWEIGLEGIALGLGSISDTNRGSIKWFPHLKGGVQRWCPQETFVINLANEGKEIREHRSIRGQSRSLPGEDYYFSSGLTWSRNAGMRPCFALVEGGNVLDVNSSFIAIPASRARDVMAILNSQLGSKIKRLLNPTISYQAGDVERFPVPDNAAGELVLLSTFCEQVSTLILRSNETNHSFLNPPRAVNSLMDLKMKLEGHETEIDVKVSELYGLCEEDLAPFSSELVDTEVGEEDATGTVADDDDEDAVAADLSPAAWARSWISYALGVVLGRFEIGTPGGLGCGDFPEASVENIRNLIDPDGIMPCEAGHPQDLAARAFACLELMLGATEARDAVRNTTGTEGEPVEALRGWLDRFTGQPVASFWRYHHQLYRKRPVYWPFQSPQKTFTVWVFHEKIGPNTLHAIKELADVQLNLLERKITDLRPAAATNRAKEKDLQKLLEQSDDIREFSNRLKAHIDAGYQSCIDDGVLLNAAPLHDLFPNWTDTKKAWEELKAGKNDWAHQAMRHWPDRVTDACRNNRSFAIAHGVEHLCPAAPPKVGKKAAKKTGKVKLDLESLL